MLKQLAAIGIGAALILSPLTAYADDAPTPAATTAPVKKVVHHHKAKHVVKKPVAAKPMVKHHVVKHHVIKKPTPAPTPTPTKS
jgi:hypothetical protein